MVRIKRALMFIGLCTNFLTLYAQNWEKKRSIPLSLAFPVVVELRGNIHVMGGGGPLGATDIHLRYKPALDQWDTLPSLPYYAQQAAGAVVNDKIYFCGGGFPNTGNRLDNLYYYDPDSVKWFAAEKMPVATAIHKAIGFDNKMFVLSGQPNKTLCETYDPGSKTWVQKNALPDQNFWYSAIAASKKAIFRFGGGGYTVPTRSAHIYEKSGDSWASLPSLPVPLHAPAAAMLNDSTVFISGGYNAGATYNTSYLYDVVKRVYYNSDTLPYGINYHSMVMAQGCAYSVGGYNTAEPNDGITLLRNCAPQAKSVAHFSNPIKLKPYTFIHTGDKMSIAFLHSTHSYDVEINNHLGQLVHARQLDLGLTEFNSGDYAKGSYTVKISGKDVVFFEKWLVY